MWDVGCGMWDAEIKRLFKILTKKEYRSQNPESRISIFEKG
jgi:hypothetical protein